MEEIDGNHSRDGPFTLMRHAVLTSPILIQLVTHLLVIVTSFLTALALALVTIAFGATFTFQCFSVICVVGKFLECFNEVSINMAARLVSFFLSKRCFSRGATGERERMAVGSTIIRIGLGCWWSSFAYRISVDKLHRFYQSWSFFTTIIAQVWLQLLIVRVESMFKRGQSDASRGSRRDRAIFSFLILLTLGLISSLILTTLSKEFSLESVAMLRNSLCALYQGILMEKLIMSQMSSELSNAAYVYEDSAQQSKLTFEVFQLLLQVALDISFFIGAADNRRMLLLSLLVHDAVALSEPLVKIVDVLMYERHVKKKFPRLSVIEFSEIEKDETCPVCLESHSLRETVRLPCSHLVHSSCVLSMARVAAANTRMYRTGLQYPMSTVAHRCPICRASLNYDSNPPSASSVGLTGLPPSITINPPSNQPTAVINDGSEFITAQRLVPPSSLSDDMIRRTFGGRVLVALTTRHFQQTVGLGDDTNTIRRVRISAASGPTARMQPLEVHSLPPTVVRPARAVAALDGERNVIAGGQRTNVRHAATASSTGRDAQLHAVLDYWYPAADQSNDAVTQTAPPTSSSTFFTRALPTAVPEIAPPCLRPSVDSAEISAGESSQAVRRQGKRKRAVSGFVESGSSLDGTVAVARRSSPRLTCGTRKLKRPQENAEPE